MNLIQKIICKIRPPEDISFNAEDCLTTLRRLGFRCEFCVDVGAYHGEWTRIVKRVFQSSKVLMVDALPAKREQLERVAQRYSGVELAITLLGPASGEVVRFHEMETGSSVLPEQSLFLGSNTERTTQALDDLLQERGAPKVDLLKLDVQGYELAVLRGAGRTLTQADVVIMEASLLPVNTGCPLLAEVVSTMEGYGFQLHDIFGQTRRRDGVLWQTDLAFVRRGAPFQPAPKLTAENWGKPAVNAG